MRVLFICIRFSDYFVNENRIRVIRMILTDKTSLFPPPAPLDSLGN